jgi:hypothetical protein
VRLDTFLLCHDVTQTVGTPLLNLQGLIVGPFVVDFSLATQGGPPLALPKLWAIATFVDIQDTALIEVQWTARAGDQPIYTGEKKVVAQPADQDNHTFANVFAPLLLPRPGRYFFTATVGPRGRPRSFSKILDVRNVPGPAPAAS